METMYAFAVILLAYLLGSVSFAVVVSKAMGLPNPYTYGSGNPGATNVLRTGNKKAAILTLLGDCFKGLIALLLAKYLFGVQPEMQWVISLVAIAVFIGHVYPIFHRFQGGKGVATAAGILFGINWILGLAALSTWMIVAFFFRYSSLAALATAIFAPLYCFFLFGSQGICLSVFVIGLILIWRHRGNITKLLNGSEGKIGQK